MKLFRIILEISKVRITSAVALTTSTGYLVYSRAFETGLLAPVTGIFLLACGSSAFNHLQESKRDSLMRRTAGRPIPSGQIRPVYVFAIALALSLAGSLILFFGSGLVPMLLGLLALAWYNLIYTYLKRVTAFAVVPGSVIGAIPPLVGYVAAGGSLNQSTAWIMAFFFFIWQVPHFWLLLLKYSKDYEKAGFPSLTKVFSIDQIKFLTFIWTLSTAISALILAASSMIASRLISILIALMSLYMILIFSGLLRKSKAEFNPVWYFWRINLFVLLMMIFLAIDSLL